MQRRGISQKRFWKGQNLHKVQQASRTVGSESGRKKQAGLVEVSSSFNHRKLESSPSLMSGRIMDSG